MIGGDVSMGTAVSCGILASRTGPGTVVLVRLMSVVGVVEVVRLMLGPRSEGPNSLGVGRTSVGPPMFSRTTRATIMTSSRTAAGR